MAAALDSRTRAGAPEWIDEFMRDADACVPGSAIAAIRTYSGHSNDIAEATFSDGRVLVVKRARHEWAASCFAASAHAARLISAATDIIVPQPLPASAGSHVQAYWRIELPTLAQLWPGLSAAARAEALRSLGALMRRLHGITLPAWGPLGGPAGPATLASELERDLRHRLLPAVYAHWPAGAWALERLIEAIPGAASLHAGRTPRLVHADLHLGNVLCRVEDSRVECAGLLDLDDISGGAAEADIACFEMLHGPLFEREIAPAVAHCLRDGYGSAQLDERLVAFYRCAHLANQGFSSGLLQHEEHAAAIAAELERSVAALPPLTAHAQATIRSPAAQPLRVRARRLGTGSTSAHAAETRTLSRSR